MFHESTHNKQQASSSCGFLYVAFGGPHLAMGLRSALSLRDVGNREEITFVSNIPSTAISSSLRHELEPIIWRHLELLPRFNRQIKTNPIKYASTDYTLMVDCDTIFLQNVQTGFRLLQNFDIAMKLAPWGQRNPAKAKFEVSEFGNLKDLPHWNSGVIFFRRSEQAATFFDSWSRSYLQQGVDWDQVSLVGAALTTPARIISLDSRWNDQGVRPRPESYIWHYTSGQPAFIIREVCDVATSIAGISKRDLQEELFARARLRQKRRGKIVRIRDYLEIVQQFPHKAAGRARAPKKK